MLAEDLWRDLDLPAAEREEAEEAADEERARPEEGGERVCESAREGEREGGERSSSVTEESRRRMRTRRWERPRRRERSVGYVGVVDEV